MLKILLIIPSSTSQKITDYFYFTLTLSLPIIPVLFFCYIGSSRETRTWYIFVVAIVIM